MEVATDYDRACDVEDLIGLIDVGSGQAIVLADEPNLTTWLKLNEDDGFLVRWVYADNESDVINFAKSLSDKSGVEENCEFVIKDSELVLLAACESSDDEIYPRLRFNLSNGAYKIFTVEYEDDQTYIICHRLKKKI